MRLIFLGSGEFGVPALEALVAAGHEILAVFTQPDRPAGRGHKPKRTPICGFASARGMAIHQPETLKAEAPLAILRRLVPDLAVVVAYGHLIPKPWLTIPRLGFINLHASLLPKYRGAAPVPHAILNGETETGVTVFRLNERFDEGDILAQAAEPILPDDTSASLLKRLAVLGAKVLTETVAGLAKGSVIPRPQSEAGASRAPRLRKEDGHIRWSATCVQIDRLVRAFQPWPLAFTFFPLAHGEKQRVAILAVEFTEAPIPAEEVAIMPGAIRVAHAKRGIVVQCGDGCLRLARLKPEGRGEMSDCEYMRSADLEPHGILT
ncbi:MAG: methionyl-tRNA formyltransferase [Planctomycetota bacterium]|nr:methionyl-tRNA formyltransferase [Planctomycetota bacterium]